MAQWHPVDTLLPTAWLLPKPGSKVPFAEIRWLEVVLDGVSVWRFRAVTVEEPRRLIGYYEELRDAASAAYHLGLSAMQPASDFGNYNPVDENGVRYTPGTKKGPPSTS